MLQIFDRVLAQPELPEAGDADPLFVGALAFQGILDIIRSPIVVRAATLLDRRLARTAHAAVDAKKRVIKKRSEQESATGNPPAEVRRIRGRGARRRGRRRVGCDEPGGER